MGFRAYAKGGLYRGYIGFRVYLEVSCTYNLLSNCSYNLALSPITTVPLDIIGL